MQPWKVSVGLTVTTLGVAALLGIAGVELAQTALESISPRLLHDRRICTEGLPSSRLPSRSTPWPALLGWPI